MLFVIKKYTHNVEVALKELEEYLDSLNKSTYINNPIYKKTLSLL